MFGFLVFRSEDSFAIFLDHRGFPHRSIADYDHLDRTEFSQFIEIKHWESIYQMHGPYNHSPSMPVKVCTVHNIHLRIADEADLITAALKYYAQSKFILPCRSTILHCC